MHKNLHDELKARKRMRQILYEFLCVGYTTTKKVCVACNGSGYYDSDGSPDCSSCNGTGKETERVAIATLYQTDPQRALQLIEELEVITKDFPFVEMFGKMVSVASIRSEYDSHQRKG